MTTVICSHDETALTGVGSGSLPVLLFSQATNKSNYSLGAQVQERFIKKLPAPPSTQAFDFLSLALGITASDTFVRRDDTADSWHREIHLKISLANPDTWKPQLPLIVKALSFLTGDHWEIELADNGFLPTPEKGKSCVADSICLFSGGMDSLIGAIDAIADGRNPLFVSHSPSFDQKAQKYLVNKMGIEADHLSVNMHPLARTASQGGNETSTRSRSLLFMALGSMAASSVMNAKGLSTLNLIVPENGFISVNAPLTPRRLGARSTRTTHPYFLSTLQTVLSNVGLPVSLVNPYLGQTKGEMLSGCKDAALVKRLAKYSVSCGRMARPRKGFSPGTHCGACLPCMVRRAAFNQAAIVDDTNKGYVFDDLAKALKSEAARDDVLATLIAIERHSNKDMTKWASSNGPLPSDKTERHQRLDAVRNGLAELKSFLKAQGCIP